MNKNQSENGAVPPQRPVLVVGEYGVLNGGERSFLAVAEHLIARGWRYVAAVPSDSPFESALQKIGIHNVGLTTHTADGTRLNQAELRDQIVGLVDVVQPCLLHANSLSMSRLVGPLSVKVRSVGYLRDILKLSKKATADINQNDRVVAVSDATAQWHVDHGLDADCMVTVYNGVDSEVFCPLSCADDNGSALNAANVAAVDRLRQEFGFSLNDIVLLYVGQIGMRKGICDLADIFIHAAEQVTGLKLLVVGERNSTKAEAIEYERDIHDRLNASSVGQQVKWLGRREDVADLMRLADILVHPARQEPLGRVLLEASASALPIVTTAVGGSPEILSGPLLAENLFSVGDNAKIAERIVRLSGAAELRCLIGQEQRQVALRRFSIAQCCKSLSEVYFFALDLKWQEIEALEDNPTTSNNGS